MWLAVPPLMDPIDRVRRMAEGHRPDGGGPGRAKEGGSVSDPDYRLSLRAGIRQAIVRLRVEDNGVIVTKQGMREVPRKVLAEIEFAAEPQ